MHRWWINKLYIICVKHQYKGKHNTNQTTDADNFSYLFIHFFKCVKV